MRRFDAAAGIPTSRLRGEAYARSLDVAVIVRAVSDASVRFRRVGLEDFASARFGRALGWARAAALWRRAANAPRRAQVLTLRERAWQAERGYFGPWVGEVPEAHTAARWWRR